MNEKTIKLLEFDVIKNDVSSYCLSVEAEELLLSEQPCLKEEEVKELKALTSSLTNRMLFLGGELRESLPSIGQVLPKLAVDGMVLDADEFFAIGVFITGCENLKQWLLKPMPVIPGNDFKDDPIPGILASLPECSDIREEIFRVFDREGNLRDLPEFREIKRRIRSLQKDIESAGSRYVKKEEIRKMLQSEIPSQRDGRMVLAVKANFRGRIRGIVHEVSSSGQTIFIEPEEVVEKNNELLLENRRLDAEIRRVLRELTGSISGGRDRLKAFHKGMVYLETLRARARYGFEKKYNFISDEREGKLILKEARHPLLGRNAVPLDLAMTGIIRTVIITGPNTGGKTVALKTLGLLALMNQFGLAIPASQISLLPVFDGVYADIGDEQSISQSLSTFSAHMINIAQIIKSSGERSLVLLDELGSGTDPEEGSAIAMAILDHFIEEKSRLIVTTHHGILKNYGYTTEGVENASMEFDGKTLSPTYKIVMGIPGESRALDIAYRNGFPHKLIKGARHYLDNERSDVSALITGLKEKHRELDLVAEAGKIEEKRLIEERREADLRQLRLRQKELELRADGAGSLRALLTESRKTLENLVREVKEGELNREKTLKVKDFLSNLEEQVRAEDEKLIKETKALRSTGPKKEKLLSFKVGADVLVGETRKPGRIIRKDKKTSNEDKWIVEIGSVKLSINESELQLREPEKTSKQARKTGSWTVDLAPSAPLSMELSLRGMRLQEALSALDRQIEAAILGGLSSFAVIHGKGEGILSKGVHDYLKKDRRIADYHFSHPELGGFGRTEVALKTI
ncbi:MAG: endonuclease MutS2 [Treponema sp.]|nr:endonuclease MutS2 [Treponema sp.]